ncbi:MAG: phage tail protein [Eubacterium sp.]|jgi:uncharacterized phage protein gp47/JayE|nr:phage tail protein [Eubacterium sp.]
MFEAQSFEEISARMLASVDDKFDKREGSVIYDAIAPIAMELAFFYTCLDMVMEEVFADTTSYYYLIKRAAEIGLFPREETQAVLKMQVAPADAAITVGDRFNLNDLNYTVVKAVEGVAGAYQVQCETAGTIGNQQLGFLLPFETANELNDLESAELMEILVPGEDEEDVEDFRERYFSFCRNESFGGNQMDYKDKINEMDGVGGCKVIRVWEQGYDPALFIPTDAVANWYGTAKDTLPDEVRPWLDAVYKAASEKQLTVGGTVKVIIISAEYKAPSAMLVDRVQTLLDPAENTGEGTGLAPIGHVVNVAGVVPKEVDVSMAMTFRSGYSFAALKDTLEQTLDDYFQELSQGWENADHLIVRVSEVETRFLKIAGVEDVTDVTLNAQEGNLILGAEEIPVRGGISNG